MKSLIAFILLFPLFTLNKIIAQESQNYWEYHELTNKAEQCIGNENFQEAFTVYNQLFNNYDFIFLKDYKIAAQLALLSFPHGPECALAM